MYNRTYLADYTAT